MKKLFILLFLFPLMIIAQEEATKEKIPTEETTSEPAFPVGKVAGTSGTGGGTIHRLQENPHSTQGQSTATGAIPEAACACEILPADVLLGTPTNPTSDTATDTSFAPKRGSSKGKTRK